MDIVNNKMEVSEVGAEGSLVGPSVSGSAQATVSVLTGTEGKALDGSEETSVPRKKNRCGAAKKRAKRAREAAAVQSTDPSTPSLSKWRGGEGQAGKRCRAGSEETPPSVAKVTKRPRSQATGLYAGAADLLARAIVMEGYPEMGITPEQLTLLRGAMATRMLGIQEGPLPRFVGTAALRNGAVMVRCADDVSLSWLTGQIGSISPWEGARLRVVGLEELQGRRRAVVWVPGPPRPASEVLGLLERQNPGIRAPGWRVYTEGEGSSNDLGRSFVFGILESSVLRLRALDFMLSFGIEQVSVKVNRSQRTEMESRPDPKT